MQAPLLLIVALYGTHDGGQFALAQRVIGLPTALVAAAIGQVFFAEAARVSREDPRGLRPLFLRTTRSLALAAAGPFALLAVASPLLFGVVFGSDWTIAGIYVAILAPMFYAQFVSGPTGAMLGVMERQDLHLYREIVRVSLVAMAAGVAVWLRWGSLGAVAAMSVAGCLTYLAYGAMSWRALNRARFVPEVEDILPDEVADVDRRL